MQLGGALQQTAIHTWRAQSTALKWLVQSVECQYVSSAPTYDILIKRVSISSMRNIKTEKSTKMCRIVQNVIMESKKTKDAITWLAYVDTNSVSNVSLLIDSLTSWIVSILKTIYT